MLPINFPLMIVYRRISECVGETPLGRRVRKIAFVTLCLSIGAFVGCDFLTSTTDFSLDDSAGGAIAFASTRSGNFDIYLMDADGANVQQITASDVDERAPTWSPDGTLIAYSKRHEPFNDDIFAMTIASGAETNLTDTPGSDGFPRWSPDGLRITFESRRDGNANVYVMDADGHGLERLTTHLAFDGLPGHPMARRSSSSQVARSSFMRLKRSIRPKSVPLRRRRPTPETMTRASITRSIS